MPVTRPAYGRKLQPFVTPPDTTSKKAKAAAKKAAMDSIVATVLMTSTIVS